MRQFSLTRVTSTVRKNCNRLNEVITPSASNKLHHTNMRRQNTFETFRALNSVSRESMKHDNLQMRESLIRKGTVRPTYAAIEIASDGSLRAVRLTLPEILRKSSLHVRDLFSLALTEMYEDDKGDDENKNVKDRFYKLHYDAILPREHEIIISFGYTRAMISTDSVMLFDAQNPSVQKLATHLSSLFELKSKEARNIWLFEPKKYIRYLGEPFELVFLEEVLRDTCGTYRRRMQVYKPIVDSLLSRVHNEVFSDQGVHRLMPIKDSLQEFEIIVKSSLTCLKQMLESNDDLIALLITEKMDAAEKTSGADARSKHQSVELLFEEYARQLNTLLQEINFLLKRVQSKQELIAISLSAYRNRMITMNVYLSIAGVSFASGTAMTSWFGMNLLSGLETSLSAFSNVVLSTSLISASVFVGCVSYISGSNMKKRAIYRHEEIQTLTGALSNMEAIDYAVRCMADQNRSFSRDSFRDKLIEFRQRPIEEREFDMLFRAVEVGKAGILKGADQ